MNFQDIETELAKLGLDLPNNVENYDKCLEIKY